MIWFETGPPGAGLTIFAAILPNFVTGVFRLAGDNM
jgi:hypothetical protein